MVAIWAISCRASDSLTLSLDEVAAKWLEKCFKSQIVFESKHLKSYFIKEIFS